MSPALGAIFETWVVNEILQQLFALSAAPNAYHWRSAGGAKVDLILEQNGKLYPIEIKCKTNLTKADLSGLNAFRAAHQNVMPGLIIYAGSESYKIEAATTAIPWRLI